MRKAKYNGDWQCPLCGSSNVTAGDSDFETGDCALSYEGYIIHDMTCNICRAKWKQRDKETTVFYNIEDIYDSHGNKYEACEGEDD